MRRYRHRDGSLRVWFGPEEIDQMAEEALHRAGLLPRLEAPVVDVEGFLEGYLGADLDQYAPLPHDVLGATGWGEPLMLWSPKCAPVVRLVRQKRTYGRAN
ncbi:MAG: hypothetical protein QN192_00280 [Armatimonadota bacterium]|nr:hypothetical protein [Armatimonadota bacterium]